MLDGQSAQDKKCGIIAVADGKMTEMEAFIPLGDQVLYRHYN
jgi:hypothetical protein